MLSITPERKKQLNELYAQRVANATPAETQEEWFKHLVLLWQEGRNPKIFMDIRSRGRGNGLRLANAFLQGSKTVREFFNQIQEFCQDAYASDLNRYGIVGIDRTSGEYRAIREQVGFEVLQAFRDVDPDDKTAVCLAMANNWHQWIRLLHQLYGLPDPRVMRRELSEDSDAEETVLDAGSFETRMTARERAEWEALVA